jgi:hypothetical protein
MKCPMAVAFCAVLLPVTLQSQQGTQYAVSGLAGQDLVHSTAATTTDRFSGLMLGAEGALVSDRFVVRLRYTEGHITPKSTAEGTTPDARDVVAGSAVFGYRAVPWLTLWGGPSARAYTLGSRDQRWLIWTAGATARGNIVPGRMQTFVELWSAVSGTVGNPSVNAGGSGANGGLEVRLGEAAAFWSRLGYRIEATHAQGMRETVESLTLSLVYGLPQ